MGCQPERAYYALFNETECVNKVYMVSTETKTGLF